MHKIGGILQKEKINFLKRKIYGESCAGATQIIDPTVFFATIFVAKTLYIFSFIAYLVPTKLKMYYY